MKILGIDTSSKFLSLALHSGRDLVTEEKHLLGRRHSDLLVIKIKEMLEKAGFSIGEVDAFVIGLGPGSFTGLRIGVSAVKGFSIATSKSSIGIPSIDALAFDVDEEKRLIVPIIDAKRQQVYSAIYEKKKGYLVRKTRHLLLKPEDLLRKIKSPAVFLGDGIDLYKEKIEKLGNRPVFLNEESWYPKASNLIKLALDKIGRYRGLNLAKLKPIYLYAKDCQVKKK